MRHAAFFALLLAACPVPVGTDLAPDAPADTDQVVDTDRPLVHDTDTPSADTDDTAPPVDCGPIAAAGYDLCAARVHACDAVYSNSSDCHEVCATAGLTCGGAYENLNDSCGADLERPLLDCASGHQSDFCVCVDDACQPSCGTRTCGANGCGGLCGQCQSGYACNGAGACEEAAGPCSLGLCGLPPKCDAAGCIAFPGAEGEGRFAEGGSAGDVYHVTTLADSGPGSFRDGVSGSGARTVVFDIGGIIDLNSTVSSTRNKLTIAGQTAPGEGITLRDWGVNLLGNDVVVRHVHFRAGDREKKTANRSNGFTEDSFTFGGSDVIIDHVSASWGIDECLSGNSGAFDRVTVQYCMVAEGLRKSGLFHGEVDPDHNGHSMGSLIKSTASSSDVSIHHNLFVSNGNRNPAVGTYDKDTQAMDADIRNNVLYNCDGQGYVSGESKKVRVNYIGNYGVWGPDSDDNTLFDGNEDSNVGIFQADNRLDKDRNQRFNAAVGGWGLIGSTYNKLTVANAMEPVTTHSSLDALTIVLDRAGAFPWDRDAVDERLVAEVRSAGRSGKIIDEVSQVGGQPAVSAGVPVVDTDRDGMPDSFELVYGTQVSVADGGGDLDHDGWTNLDAYLHWAANR